MKKSKRILIVTASPRKNGNSTILAPKAAEGVDSNGGEADVVHIDNLEIAPCNAYDICRIKPEGGCVIRDDMQPLYQRISDAEGIIFASPVYWFNLSARAHAVKDGGDYAFTGKDVGVILTFEDEDILVSGGINALRSFQDICAYVKANLVGTVYGSADKAGAVRANGKLLQKAYDLGRKIVN